MTCRRVGVAFLLVLAAACASPNPLPHAPPTSLPIAPVTSVPTDAGSAPAAAETSPEPPTPGVRALSVGFDYACVVLVDQRVVCWGHRDNQGWHAAPVVIDIPPADRVRVGADFACARMVHDHSLQCWGENRNGVLGRRKVSHDFEPPAVVLDRAGSPLPVDDFLVGSSHVCVLAPSGVVSCWGNSISGEAGKKPVQDASGRWVPVLEPVVVFRGAVRLYGGAETSCAVDAKEQLHCWGGQDAGYSGLGDTFTPKLIATPGPVRAMAFASGHSCILIEGGTVHCRGWNPGGQLGAAGRPQKGLDGKGAHHADFEPRFVRIGELTKTYRSLAAARHETCAVSTEGELTCIGTPDWVTALSRHPANAKARPATWQPRCQQVPSAPPPTFKPPAGSALPQFTTWTCNPVPEPGTNDVVEVAAEMGRRCTLHVDGRVRCVGQRHDGTKTVIDDEPALVDLSSLARR